MDRVVAFIVRLMAICARWAHVLPSLGYERYTPGDKVKVLLVGYNGARNTGSDVRVASLARLIRDAFGPDEVELSVMTLDPESTAPYFDGVANQIALNTYFFIPLLKACSQNHVAVLCEGSTFKSKFADALTLYTCEAAGIMRSQGKPCVAFGGEVGAMTPFLEREVRALCPDVYFMARSGASYDEAVRLGLRSRRGTDTAWTFDSASGHDVAMALLREGGWDGESPLLGIAPINPFCWPVVPSIPKWAASAFGKATSPKYMNWYFFSWSEQRSARFQRYLDGMSAGAFTFARENGYTPVIIGMEKLDKDACAKMSERLGRKVPVVLSNELDGYVIGEVLRSLSLLVTSRYHAQVLATGANVPAVAVSMDERLDNLAEEFGLPGELLMHVDQPDLAERILIGLDCARDSKVELQRKLAAKRAELTALLNDMTGWFADYLAEFGIEGSAP